MVTIREDPLINECYYHIYTRSIAKFIVFNNTPEYSRMFQLIDLSRFKDFNYRFSKFKDMELESQSAIIASIKTANNPVVKIIAYCIMPTHIHLILKQVETDGITQFVGRILNSYSKYFNTHHRRSGPLWNGRFKNVLVEKDNQLLHLTRYIHLNPTSAGLVKKPEDWEYSSYKEYLSNVADRANICEKDGFFDLDAVNYKKFVNDQKDYQRNLAIIKNTLIDNYTG